jgi:hypothetical protein
MPWTWRKLTTTGKEFPGAGSYIFTNPEDVVLGDWCEDDEEANEVLLGRWKGEKLWHPATGGKPMPFINEPHPRYPKASPLDHHAWRLFTGVPKVHNPLNDEYDDDGNPLEDCYCRRCVAGKIASSRKPEELQDRIDKWLDPHLGGFSKIELFATRRRELRGSDVPWICVGGDVDKQDIFERLEELAFLMGR